MSVRGLIKGDDKDMNTSNTLSPKVSGLVSKTIDKLMLVFGTVALVWILLFLLVAMIEK
jgi:hypothetical protein